MTDPVKTAVFSLYRSFRRQISLLPSEYLRQFFRIKLKDDVQNVLKVPALNERLRRTKFKRVRKELRKIEAANARDSGAYRHILDVAYGRKGKLRHEIMEPLLTDPNAPLPDRIIPAMEKSRPPVFSPELTALLTSNHSRESPLSPSALKKPPLMPERADPTSEDARLLGPLSKRREVNIRWRYFTAQSKKCFPPLQVEVLYPAAGENKEQELRTDREFLDDVGIRPVGLQGSGVVEDLISSAGPDFIIPPQTRRERSASGKQRNANPSEQQPLPRFIRRRYRELLSRMPILTYNPKTKTGGGKYSVSVAPNVLNASTRYSSSKMPTVDDTYLTWVETPASRKS
ncbi:hypothetical protein EIP86_010554 [Pleurotus ostreatoroseus]|nr:hypothetical protein EIP86_010554 [Pleurotus ostreatoroseus]